MTRPNRIRQLLGDGDVATTAWLSTGNAYTAEVLGHCGYDAVTVDLQHGMFGVEAAIACLQAVSSTPAVPLVRCRSNDAEDIGHLLDAGAYGVVCPAINGVDDATRFVGACRYPPRGRRSYGPSRGLLYGGRDYVDHADSTVLAIAMIESIDAVDAVDAIVAVDGLDAVYVGPNDLAVSGGYRLLGEQPPVPELADVLRHIVDRSRAAAIPAGIFAPTVEHAVLFASWGYQLIAPGNDVGLLRAESARRLRVLRGVDDGEPVPGREEASP